MAEVEQLATQELFVRIRLSLCWATLLVATSGIACQDNGLGPSAHVRVTMTMQEIALPPGVALARPQIVVKGDSVVTATVIFTSGCYRYTVSGQAPTGQLTLTIVETEAESDCTPAGLVEGLSVVAHGLPAGFRYARLVDRLVRLDGSGYEVELTNGSIDLP